MVFGGKGVRGGDSVQPSLPGISLLCLKTIQVMTKSGCRNIGQGAAVASASPEEQLKDNLHKQRGILVLDFILFFSCGLPHPGNAVFRHPPFTKKKLKKIKLPIKLPVGLGGGSLWGTYSDLGSPAVEGLQRKSCLCSRTALGRTLGGRRPPGGSPQTPVLYLAALLGGDSRLPDGE